MKKIILSECGILPNIDITLQLRKVFEENQEDTIFVFENADYYFSPKSEMKMDYRLSNTDVSSTRTLAVLLKNMQNCILYGNGARFWFEGHMQPLTLDRCNSVRVENIMINWKKPMVAEGIILSYTKHSADVYVDSQKFPHRYIDNWLEFDIGAGEWYPLCGRTHTIFEPHSKCVRPNTGDQFVPTKIQKLEDNLYRFSLERIVEMREGDIVVLRHNARMHAGIFAEKCEDLTFENITIHSSGGIGCLAQFCHNLTYKRVRFVPDIVAGRLVSSGRDDGIHLTCNSGKLKITECTFAGLMDDPVNVHGCCVTVDDVVSSSVLRCRYRHKQAQGFLYWAEDGDEIAFINRKNMSRVGVVTVRGYILEESDTFLLEFKHALSEEIISAAKQSEGIALDNLTHTASLVCTKNRFGSCRARGVLVSTPKQVYIADNYFETAGSAILISGDSNQWFESGECNNVEICNNVFTSRCLTSKYQFCNGVISICPVIPIPDIEKPYHKNIRITDNVFDAGDEPVLYAYSCADLRFLNNRILQKKSEESVLLSYCLNSRIMENEWIG